MKIESRKAKIVITGENSAEWKDFLVGLGQDYEIEEVAKGKECLAKISAKFPTVILLDMDEAGAAAVDLIKEAKNKNEQVDVVAITSKKNVEDAVHVINAGAMDYIDRSEDKVRILSLIERSVESQERSREIHILRSELASYHEEEVCFGKNPEIDRVLGTIDRIASLPTTVLLQGESGTGKEVFARHIHRKSHLGDKPFVTVNLPSIPSNLVESVLFGHEKGAFTGAHRRHYGKFELADGGTIFLDEIGDLQFDVQSKLLRVIQEGEIERVGGSSPIQVNVRVIAATKLDLKSAVKKGKFRDDLFYRLNVIPISLPPLRRHLKDIPAFVNLFIRRYAAKFGKSVKSISNDALDVLKAYHWPGNIRELENVVERMIAMADSTITEISKTDIPFEYYIGNFTERSLSNMNLDEALVKYERNLIIKTLKSNNWNRKRTAQALGVSYGILKYKVRKLNIEIPGSAPRKT